MNNLTLETPYSAPLLLTNCAPFHTRLFEEKIAYSLDKCAKQK